MQTGNQTINGTSLQDLLSQAITVTRRTKNSYAIDGIAKECNNGSCNFYVQLGNTIAGVVLDATNYFELVIYPEGTTLNNVDHFKHDEV
jgi:hypothetical protein